MLLRSSFIFRERFNLSDNRILDDEDGDEVPVPFAPGAPRGGAFAGAWRNYLLTTVFKTGFMYKITGSPSVILVLENKILVGREGRPHLGEAVGRKLVLSFFEHVDRDLVQRVDRTDLALKQQLLTLAELLQNLGVFVLPVDPDRTAGETECLLEMQYKHFPVLRYDKLVESAAGVHMYTLDNEVLAEEAALAPEEADQRTKMVLARCLERNGGLGADETLRNAWSLTLPELEARAAPYLPAPAVPLALAVVPPGPGRGGARGRAGRGRGRGGRA